MFTEPRSVKTILTKKNVEEITLLAVKYNNQETVVLCTDTRNRHTGKWKRRKNPEIEPHFYNQLIFDNSTKIIQWCKENLFNK